MMVETIREALRNIRSHKLRSFLSVLGVMIGVGSVVIMISIIEGARARVVEEFEELGSNLIFVVYERRGPGEWPVGDEEEDGAKRIESLTLDDAAALKVACPSVGAVAPQIQIPTRAFRMGRSRRVQLIGITDEANRVQRIEVVRGRPLNETDVTEWKKVCLIGARVAERLFGDEDPLGQEIRVHGLRLTVVGVLKKVGQVMGEQRDDFVYTVLPVVLQYITGNKNVSAILARAVTPEKVEQAADEIWMALRRRYGDLPGLRVDTQSRVLEAIGRILAVFGALFGGIGGLALLVGGIGIMNIMLVSVTERIREIGIRKAVGARNEDILWQFLIESMTLSGVGGIMGAIFGWLLSTGIGAALKEQMPTYVPPWAVLLAFSFALLVGLFFGIYPALRAARLAPVECLRYE
ncbi:MAG: ABC transporter permease [Armatimonadetes bacterium]|nr:ABC transporter permease [Armatimonadota bacterium]MDW8122087.1 ABC transporter permease [Armatimonadota bacterium]